MPALNLPLIIEPNNLLPHLHDDKLLLVDLSSVQTYVEGHVPGAVLVTPQMIVAGTPPAPGKLPSAERLNQLFSHLGLQPDTHVVAYDDEGGGWAGRFLWTLDMIGHTNYSYLNGGIWAWRSVDGPLSSSLPEQAWNDITPSSISVVINQDASMTKEDIIAQLNHPEFLVWDARTVQEYHGSKITAMKNGHIPGAVHCEWTELMDRQHELRIRADAREYLAAKGITADKHIVTHCQSHHRSGLTYLVGKSLGFNIRAYPGSWSEWGNSDDTPVEN